MSGPVSGIGWGDAWGHLSQGRAHTAACTAGPGPSAPGLSPCLGPGARAGCVRRSDRKREASARRAAAPLSPCRGASEAPPCPRSRQRRAAVLRAAHQRRDLRPGLLQPARPARCAAALRAALLQCPHQVRPPGRGGRGGAQQCTEVFPVTAGLSHGDAELRGARSPECAVGEARPPEAGLRSASGHPSTGPAPWAWGGSWAPAGARPESVLTGSCGRPYRSLVRGGVTSGFLNAERLVIQMSPRDAQISGQVAGAGRSDRADAGRLRRQLTGGPGAAAPGRGVLGSPGQGPRSPGRAEQTACRVHGGGGRAVRPGSPRAP